ncbi:MAG TPA: glycoside hydrolase family 97 N-terminal domain-containing protein, partial [Puia sp.]|nr:glycoside hydrolase family 97 N-terminal domain-containing protein [Puia sp.]
MIKDISSPPPGPGPGLHPGHGFLARITLSVALLSCTFPSYTQKSIRLSSPDKTLSFEWKVTDAAGLYSVSYKGRELIGGSPLSLSFKGQPDFREHLTTGTPVFKDGEEDYSLIVGKTSHVHDKYRELSIPLKEKTSPFREITLVVRAFNAGVAFRYEFPKGNIGPLLELTAENTSFNLQGDPTIRALLFPDFTSSHEGEYNIVPLHALAADTLVDMPALFEFPGKVYMAITEAALLDYAGMYLTKHNGMLTSRLSPLPGQSGASANGASANGASANGASSGSASISPSVGAPANARLLCVEAALLHHSPWRVLLISDRIGALIESNVIT